MYSMQRSCSLFFFSFCFSTSRSSPARSFKCLLGCMQPKLCWPIYVVTHCPIRSPSKQSRLPDEILGEGKHKSEGEGIWGVGNKRRKTMRQNQKINEALFQWQDLCTVNITLAIRGNPITLRLFSPWEGEDEGGKEWRMKREWIQREKEQEHLCMIYPISDTYLDIQEREQEREGRMD